MANDIVRPEYHVRLEARFIDILQDCKEVGWDGYGAKVITKKTLTLSRLFASMVDQYLPLLTEDEPTPCNDNSIGFEWEVASSRRNWLIVCIGEDGCYYASSYKGMPQYKGKFEMPVIEPQILKILELIKTEKAEAP